MKYNQKYNILLILIIVLLILQSCTSRKNFTYFQDRGDIKFKQNINLKLKINDLISINVFGCDEESMKIFNIPQSTNSSSSRGYFSGSSVNQVYIINNEGEIDFPVIGSFKIEGLTIEEATNLIKSKLNLYIKDPKVNIQIQNFKITILGDVKNPGTIHVPNERITILEALGIVGDLNITALRKNIILLREEKGLKKEYIVDLTNKNFINSPIYYLQQNDIIYIEANKAKINSSQVTGSSTIIIAIASLIITTVNILLK
jgi:polysaccharide export outer membrane protein